MSWIREEKLNVPPITRSMSINPGAEKAVRNSIRPVVLITSLFNFMTRLADGLGVEFPIER